MKVIFWIVFIIFLILSFVAIYDLITGPSAVDQDWFLILITSILLIGYLFRKALLKILLVPFQFFERDMNKNQRLVLAIFVPIIIFFIALMIANSCSYYGPFNLGQTWYVWFSALALCSIFEYKLFADKKDKQ